MHAEALVQLVAAHAVEAIAAIVKEQRVDQAARVLQGRRITRAQLLVHLDQTLLLGVGRIAVERALQEVVIGTGVDIGEEIGQFLIRAVPNGTQQRRDRNFSLPVDLDRQHVAVAGFELEPCAAIRDQLGAPQPPTGRRILVGGEVHARRAHELTHHDAFRAVDDERALVGHEREVAHEYFLLGNLAERLAFSRYLFYESGLHREWSGIGHVAQPAVGFAILRLPKGRFGYDELQRHLAREVGYR